ncbi:related to renal dipeptidase [Lecanosticta acicola]|uniref:Dipeptidase n=1 Tax=Lecanosticta acicola TaxID=111012 RepID=A0AAI8YYW1_9PEZI|nr:related to renal dipeptidase [Lecanosticta acicola]
MADNKQDSKPRQTEKTTESGKNRKKKSPRPPSQDPMQIIADTENRSWLYFAQFLLIITVVILAYTTGVFDLYKYYEYLTEPQLSGAQKILKDNPLVDGHNDLLILLRAVYGNRIYDTNFTKPFEEGGLVGQFDLEKAEEGLLGGTFWSAWVPCPADGFDFSDENYAPFVRATLEQIDLFHRLADKYPKYFTLPRNAAEAEKNFARGGKLISPLAIEGLHQIGNSIATLRLYHELGVRYATLNWNCHNRYSDAAVVSIDGESQRSKPYWGGVSDEGHKLIREMNRLGMLVDLSHVSPDTMRDVLGGTASEKGWKGSLAPPIFSHSSVYAICPHPRNVPDDVLELVKKRNSVVMINFSPDFISCKDTGAKNGLPELVEETNTIEQVAKHIMYIGDKIGYDHVGLGSDFDGIPSTPRGLEDVSKYPHLIDLLLEKGVSERDCAKIAGRNVLRVWHEADRVAARLRKEIDPLEDQIGKGIGLTEVVFDGKGVEVEHLH